jgi:nicotinamidase-related amidase
MATLRTGYNPVLLVVDAQKGVLASAYERESVLGRIVATIRKARAASAPVVWVQHSDAELVSKSEDWEIVAELKPEEGDYRIEKHHNSSFEDTELEERLRSLNATKIVFVGAATNWCVRATAYASSRMLTPRSP